MRIAFGKVLVGYEVECGPEVTKDELENAYWTGLPGIVGHTPPVCDSVGIWKLAIYYSEEMEDNSEQLRGVFQRLVETNLNELVRVRCVPVQGQ